MNVYKYGIGQKTQELTTTLKKEWKKRRRKEMDN